MISRVLLIFQRCYLGFDNSPGGRLEDFALSSGTFNCGSGSLGEGMGLDSDVLGSKFVPSSNNLVDSVLGLVHCLGFEKGFDWETKEEETKGKN